jgi:hypothetical protein
MQAQTNATDDGPVVYVVQVWPAGPVKIGYCSTRSGVVSRLAGLQTGNPFPLVIRNVIDAPDGITDESRFHDELARHRMVGEWFAPSPEVLKATAVRRGRGSTPDDVHEAERLLTRAFEAGREHGRLEAERLTRRMLKTFFGVAMDWLYDGEPTEDELERSCAETALRAVVPRSDWKLVRSHHASSPRDAI